MLKAEMGMDRVIARTRRHLHRQVMDLRILEFDHFENEEAFVCSEVRERMSEEEQLGIVRHLLIDESADDPRWIIDWVAGEISPGEKALLIELESHFAALTT